jgi:hypothetical protein
MMSDGVLRWWAFLCAVGALNVAVWLLCAVRLGRRRGALSSEIYGWHRWQLWLSAGYVFGCAFRSALPVYDVQRLCLVDSWLSSVVVGRSVATLAEVCFVAQWALLLRQTARSTGSAVARVGSRAIVPMIVVAEACSWYSVLTTSNLGHVAEESIWALAALLLVASLATAWPRSAAAARPFIAAGCAIGVAYVLFMVAVDVPMYATRWLADEAGGRHYLSLARGLADASQRWSISYRWQDWQHEVPWMSLYFSVAVWLSIALVHAPALHDPAGGGGRGSRPWPLPERRAGGRPANGRPRRQTRG